jgi:hypothetical protein
MLVPLTPTTSNIDELNTEAALKIGWASFARLGEITYKKGDEKAAKTLKQEDITLATDHAIVRLRQSKADIDRLGVNIYLAATYDHLCPVRVLYILIRHDPQSSLSPLFRLRKGGFAKATLIQLIRARLTRAGISPEQYFGYSLRRGAA